MSTIGECRLSPVNVDKHQIRRWKSECSKLYYNIRSFTDVCRQSQICSGEAILQSDNGREFSNQGMSEICAMWKNIKIVHGKHRHSQTQGSVERANQDIQNMLTAWMNDNDTNKWSEGLPFVKFSKNTTHHEGMRQSPYVWR
ncbi:SCAN domain-containing protein 3 [Trichonephila clavipes]|uniref:SCAN domain-containing protein 3 n=1 Tax=Trichonephila clavipes TaxID=2585209 RepID=A0A8X7B9Y1_TRICX|nr:SCAN domain-containing protein 3 [Trichonephila clavipes]